jgi:hypothetical protein
VRRTISELKAPIPIPPTPNQNEENKRVDTVDNGMENMDKITKTSRDIQLQQKPT